MTEKLNIVFRPFFMTAFRISPGATAAQNPVWMMAVAAVLYGLLAPSVFGQALPAAEASPISTGFALPLTAGTLQYAVSASESLVWGYYGNNGAASATNLTGDIGYISNSKRDPFSMVFSGGRSWSTGGQPSYGFLNLALSQVLNAGRWTFVVSDSVNYMPSTPAGGLSGIAGVGDLGVTPVQVGADTGQGVLTNYSSRVENSAALSLQRKITGKTSINASGAYTIDRFLDNTSSPANSGLDSESESGSGGISHQMNVRNTFGGNYSYSNYEYTGNTYGVFAPTFVSQTASFFYTHQFTRKLGFTAAAGPQWTTIKTGVNTTSLSAFVDASANYSAKMSRSSVSFLRSTNSGYGVLGGAISNSVSYAYSRTFGRVWNGAITASYARTSSLPSSAQLPYTFNTTVAGAQMSRALGHSLSIYGSYTAEDQSSNGSSGAVDVFNGLSHVLGFGITYSPMSVHFGQQ